MAATLPPGFEPDAPAAITALPSGFTPDGPAGWEFDPVSGSMIRMDQPGAVMDTTSPLVGGMLRGVRDPVDGAAQLLARGVEAVAPEGAIGDWAKRNRESTESANATAERDYQKKWRDGDTGPDLGRFLGNTAASAPIGGLATTGVRMLLPGARLLPAMLGSAAGGATSAALQPVATQPTLADVIAGQDGAKTTPDNFWHEKAMQAATGAGIGAAAPAIGAGLSRVVSPAVDANVRTLLDAGVTPTPGQALGGAWNATEQKAMSIPVIGDIIRNRRGDAVTGFNRAAYNRALAPIGEELGADTPVGHPAVIETQDRIRAAYDRVVPTMTPRFDPQFATDMGTTLGMSRYMPAATRDQFHNIVLGEMNKFGGGGMTGPTFQDVDSNLGRLGSQYLHSSVPDDRQLGTALLQVQDNLRNMLQRSNPAQAADYQAAREAYANFKRVQQAAARPGAPEGAFSPAQLLSSVRQSDPTVSKGAFARGQALMQDLGDAGKSVLGASVPDSGTAGRSALLGSLGAIAGLGAYSPTAAAGALTAGGLAAGAYSPLGTRLLTGALTRRPAGAENVAQALRDAAPGAGSSLASILAGMH